MSAIEWVAGDESDLMVIEPPDLSALIPLPHGHVPCRDCGIAVPLFAADVTTLRGADSSSRCQACAARAEHADARARQHPTLVKQFGAERARVRVEDVLIALEILGVPPGEGNRRFDLLHWRLGACGSDARFARLLRLSQGRCSAQPWGHVDAARLRDLRIKHAGAMADNLADSMPARDLHCPSRGCLHCGRSSVPLPELGVTRQGGVQLATARIWRAVSASPASLGLKGPKRVSGHLCPDCDLAVRSEGAIGPSARRRAFLEHAKATLDFGRMQQLQRVLADEDDVRVPAWISLGEEATQTPWFYQERLIGGR